MQNPGLYVHIPFCRSKCPYCGFFSIASTSLVSRWLGALRKEVIHYKDRFGRFDSLYLGGGTPTCLDIGLLDAVMDAVFTHAEFEVDSEITIEANPCDLTREKIKALGDLGFNRISLGVQSFDDRILAFLGRKHTASEAEMALKNLRAFGFENIGLDLIYGFEGQSIEDWKNTLRQALSFEPEHLSCYQLTFEKGTRFGRLRDMGEMNPLTEKEECAFFTTTSAFIQAHGYVHYEVSNFAREEGCTSRHNRKYWDHHPYLGLGPSAHSFDDSKRWWNVRSVRGYCEMLEGGKTPVEGSEKLTEDQLRLESISLGSRTGKGFDLSHIQHHPNSHKNLLRLLDAGFIEVSAGRVVPTIKGYLVADHLPLWFFQ